MLQHCILALYDSYPKYLTTYVLLQVTVDGFVCKPDEVLNPKKKIFEACAPDLKVNDNKQATYKVINKAILS